MIDKLELRIPSYTQFTDEFRLLYSQLSTAANSPFRSSRLYLKVRDLRPYGYEAILHVHCKHGKYGNHKLELVETGKMPVLKMIREVERIFEINARETEIMRIDFAADVVGKSVSWFQNHLCVSSKQVTRDIGISDLTRIGRRDQIETVYYGQRPNVVRIYNKIAERKMQYSRLLRNWDPSIPVPSFEEIFGLPATGHVLTRVERQCGGGRIPEMLSKLSKLSSAIDFNPFQNMELRVGIPEIDPDKYGLSDYLKGLGLRKLIEEKGLQHARKFISQKAARNSARIFSRFSDFFLSEDSEEIPDLYGIYQQSIATQLDRPN